MQEPLKDNEILLGDGRKLVYVQPRAITGGAPAVPDGTATGMALRRMEAEAAAAGPSRAMNPRPAPQADGYRLHELIPEHVLDADLESAAADRRQINAATTAMVKSGSATVFTGKGKDTNFAE